MRGDDYQQSAAFSYLSPEERVPADHPLRPIREIIDASLTELSPVFDRIYSPVGRRSIAPEKLLRAVGCYKTTAAPVSATKASMLLHKKPFVERWPGSATSAQ